MILTTFGDFVFVEAELFQSLIGIQGDFNATETNLIGGVDGVFQSLIGIQGDFNIMWSFFLQA